MLTSKPLITKIGKRVGITTPTQSMIPFLAASDATDEKIRNTHKSTSVKNETACERHFLFITNSSEKFSIFFNTILSEKRKNDLSRFKHFLQTVTELPSSSFGDRPYIEMEGDNTFKLDGCKEILSYDDNSASFSTKESRITVSGSQIKMCSFGNSTVRVTGNITKLEIERVKGNA